MTHRIYVASSWRKTPIIHNQIVDELRRAGHDVYDYRHPWQMINEHGFHWSEIDKDYEHWTPGKYLVALDHDLANRGFSFDYGAMNWADSCVLILPSGKSAHLEAGWFVGRGRPVHLFMPGIFDPELMYKMFTSITIQDVAVLVSRFA